MKTSMNSHSLILMILFGVVIQMPIAAQEKSKGEYKNRRAMLLNAERIVFLGDSITYSGGYITHFDSWLVMQAPRNSPQVINVGLPSETVSGLSEDGHAGGRFPRPDLAERLERVLKETKPDLVFACYGINCGIYQPFDNKRFEKYKAGIKNLQRAVKKSGAKLILITPPIFDDARARKKFSYDDVMTRYSRWLVELEKSGQSVIDLHTAMVNDLKRRRKQNPKFTFQPDSVHPNAAGHWLIATQLIKWFGDPEPAKTESAKVYFEKQKMLGKTRKWISDRMTILRDAYLTKSKHKRPGIRAGMSLDKAEKQVSELTKKISGVYKKPKS